MFECDWKLQTFNNFVRDINNGIENPQIIHRALKIEVHRKEEEVIRKLAE